MWKPYVRFSSFVSGLKSLGKASSHIGYLVREKECLLWGMESDGKSIDDRRKAKERWSTIGRMETGLAPLDTPAGRARSDACIQVRLFLPLPNLVFDGMTDKNIREAVEELLAGTGLDTTDLFWALHRGENRSIKERARNLHLHIAYRPRNAAGRKHRISIRREVVILRTALGSWLEQRGYAVDWKSVEQPGVRRHIAPEKIAIAERGEELHSRKDELQAELTSAKRTLAVLSRKDIEQRIVAALGSPSFGYEQLETVLREGGWRLEQKRRGKRMTWLIVENEGGKEFALRRIFERTERETDAIMKKLMKRDRAFQDVLDEEEAGERTTQQESAACTAPSKEEKGEVCPEPREEEADDGIPRYEVLL